MVDSNRSYCLRLAEVTFPLLGSKPAATASSMGRQQARVSIPEPAMPHTAPPTLREELTRLFRRQSDPPHSCLDDALELAAALESRPDVQSRLAVITQYTPSKWLLERELEASGHWHPTLDPRTGGKPDAYAVARDRAAVGLCLSGGGIRSATFNLGILQGLARNRRIRKIDLLSSVSGGGYIHQFLANWIHKAGSCSTVETLLDPIPNASGKPNRATVQPEPLRWLRRYSNYLAPRKGLFSLDSWTIVAVWMRNTALNFVVLLSGLFFLLLLPHFGTMLYAPLHGHLLFSLILSTTLFVAYVVIAVLLYRWLVDIQLPGPPPAFVKLTAVALFLASSFITPAIYRSSLPGGNSTNPLAQDVFKPITHPEELHYQTTYTRHRSNDEELKISVDSREPEPQSRLRAHWDARPRPLVFYARRTHIFLLIFLCLCAGFLTAVTWASRLHRALIPVFFVFGLIVSYVLVECIRLLFFVVAFAVPSHLIAPLGVVLIPLLTFGIPFFTVEAGLGLIGRSSDSAQREWLARARAFSFLFGGAWLLLSAVSLLGPSLFNLIASYSRTSYTLWFGWLATSIGGALSAKSSETSKRSSNSAEATDSPTLSSRLLEMLAHIAPVVFIGGLLILVAKFAAWALVVSNGADPNLAGEALQEALHHASRLRFLELALTSVALTGLFGWRVDINDFSMHTFYRDRLARCYAGASTPNRTPNRFTGFTRDDRDLRMHQLLPTGYTVFDEHGNPAVDSDTGQPLPAADYKGPFPIICTSINLTTGEDLAYQERKAASFTFTPLFSGFNVGWTAAGDARNQFNGFVPTRDYVYTRDGGIMLATAVAISGAAASPSMGYHSNPAIAFLLTVFNVRLGWWLRNPRRRELPVAPPPVAGAKAAKAPRPLPSSPRFGLLKLITELLGQSDDTTSYVYLTDGGHFDNMGLYELLRRRCRTIIVCDGEADSRLHFEGIGMAIRKARLDFGIEITLDQIAPVPALSGPGNQPPSAAPPQPKDASGAAPAASRESASIPPARPAVPSEGPAESAAPAPPPAQTSTPIAETSDPKPAEVPYTLSAHISATDPAGVTGTLTPHPGATLQGLSSFAEFPGNTLHCVHGTVQYPEDSDPSQYGHLLYIKASLTGDEPPDLLNYRRQHQNFPHDTTLNQFFTESQFESYRRLGEHIILDDKTVVSWLDRYL